MTENALAGFFADLARLYPDGHRLPARHRRRVRAGLAGGATLVRRGDPSDALYILIGGRLIATQEDADGRTLRPGEIGRGEMIGEMSLLSGGTRTATSRRCATCAWCASRTTHSWNSCSATPA
ncbi:MAG: cyclic nucleotide-binding domain-containing protein [Betaproteobacteria bacterium]|nr:cyclic nucleotide-binding domain-containing protein [Betaproteobacteria bacterium]